MHTVTICSGKWLVERDVKIHGSFKRQATIDFNELNPKAEQYQFVRDLAIPIDEFKKLNPSELMAELTATENPIIAKDIKERNPIKSGKKDFKRPKMVERWMKKMNELNSSNDEESNDKENLIERFNEKDNESFKVGSKRKVCFLSPKN